MRIVDVSREKDTSTKNPPTASEFCDMLATSTFEDHFKFSVTKESQTAVVFFSDEMRILFNEITNIQFDGTFQIVLNQFVQLWTIFVSVGRHTFPAIHCMMTSKSQELYSAVLESLVTHIPQFKPLTLMSDWEPAPRNALKEIYPQMKIYGCWFHFTQCVWRKTQKLGLTRSFKDNVQVSQFIRQPMVIPFLPAALIIPTYNLIETPVLPVDLMLKLEKLKKYFKKQWLNQISPEESSVYEINMTTDNGAESYHSKLKSRMRCSHPRIWTFMTNLNEIIKDTNNDISRLYQGREISRSRSKSNLKVGEQRIVVKQKLSEGGIPCQVNQSFHHHQPICLKVGVSLASN